jgi:hypothetical protein
MLDVDGGVDPVLLSLFLPRGLPKLSGGKVLSRAFLALYFHPSMPPQQS